MDIKEEKIEEWKPQTTFVQPYKGPYKGVKTLKRQKNFKNHPTCLYEFCRRVSSQTFLCSSKTIPGLLICNACKSYEDQNDKLIPRNARRRLGRGGRNHSNKTQCDRCQQKSTKTRKNKNGEIKYVYIASPLNPDISLCSHCYRSESRQLRRARKRREKQQQHLGLNIKEEDQFYQPPELRRKKTKRKQKRKVSVGDFVESEKDGMQGTVLEVGKMNITILNTASVVHEIPKGKIKVIRSADKLPDISVKAEDDDLYVPPDALPKSWGSSSHFVQDQATNPFPIPSLPPTINIPNQETDEVKAGDWLETNGFEGIVLEVETDVISLLVGNDVLKVRRFTSPVRAVSPDLEGSDLPPMFEMDSNFVNVQEPVIQRPPHLFVAFDDINQDPFKTLATIPFSETELKKLDYHYFTEKRYRNWTKPLQERFSKISNEATRLILLRFMQHIESPSFDANIELPYQLLYNQKPLKQLQISDLTEFKI